MGPSAPLSHFSSVLPEPSQPPMPKRRNGSLPEGFACSTPETRVALTPPAANALGGRFAARRYAVGWNTTPATWRMSRRPRRKSRRPRRANPARQRRQRARGGGRRASADAERSAKHCPLLPTPRRPRRCPRSWDAAGAAKRESTSRATRSAAIRPSRPRPPSPTIRPRRPARPPQGRSPGTSAASKAAGRFRLHRGQPAPAGDGGAVRTPAVPIRPQRRRDAFNNSLAPARDADAPGPNHQRQRVSSFECELPRYAAASPARCR